MSVEPNDAAPGATQELPLRNPAVRRPQARKGVSMSVVNFWLDAALLASLVEIGWVTAMLRFVFPAPSAAAGWSLWGWTFDQWWDFQFGSVCFFALLVLGHVMLHWNWVCSVIANQVLRLRSRPDEGMQTIYGVATLIVLLHLLGVGVLLAMAFVRHPAP